ncbi:DUF262 domain-containing protein [Cobetia amphilecti]|uniref:DUF262 domain-containing protein n=1 Tax=Cobetia amphilecti TaxID=1055104 RepID=UPI0026E2BB8D|nr:DUF262 domain-containing protein [Cobetia amphilecti]MDO6814268.1 DUF262 domain-containing protein [Cobetia amphilecti]
MKFMDLQAQLEDNRRSVAFDSYDISVRQLYDMTLEGMIDIAPDYQRHFVWDEARQSELIESLFLGIPVPTLYMATNRDSSWEVIDGLQRLTTIINYVGSLDVIKEVNAKGSKLKISSLEKLSSLNGTRYEDLPKSLQVMFQTRPIRVTVLNDRSDNSVRYDLFERLNTGGVNLHPQEIRNCVYTGEFNDFIKELSMNDSFRNVVKVTKSSANKGVYEELVLKFFCYYEQRDKFVHNVKEFLNDYMESKTKSFKNKVRLRNIFEQTFNELERSLPNGIVRGNRLNVTPMVLFEAIAIGTADVIDNDIAVRQGVIQDLLDNEALKKLTSGATNSRKRLHDRINFVKDAIEHDFRNN